MDVAVVALQFFGQGADAGDVVAAHVAAENAILALRSKYPSWGARKLKARLEKLDPGVEWPSASTVGNILGRAGLTSPTKKKRRTTPYSEPFSEVTAPNQLWCMDFKGNFNTGDGTRSDPFTVTDAYSRYLIRCQIVSRMDFSQVRAICEAAMREYPRTLAEFIYPKSFLGRKVNNNGDISWQRRRVFISEVFRFEEIGLEHVGEDLYKVFFHDVELGQFDAEALRFRPARLPR